MLDAIVLGLSGAAAGALHVLAGPDHLAALAPLVATRRRAAWRTGLSWGLGHTGGVLLVGSLALFLKTLLPLDRVSSISERAVGVALVAVGVFGVRRAMRAHVHAHEHRHGGSRHAHLHLHGEALEHHAHAHASVGLGVLHGLAGSAHLFGVLPALALPAHAASAAYLVGFGAGTVAAMTLFSSTIGLLAASLRQYGARAYQGLLGACSALAIGVGGYWLAS